MKKGIIARAWSAAEDDALLRAWADVAERRPRSQAKGLLQSYHALFRANAAEPQERTAQALLNRRAMHVRMYDIICAFHSHMQQQHAQQDGNNGSGDATTSTTADPSAAAFGHTQPKYSSADWFELSVHEQKRWFASLDTKTYPFHEIQRVTFERVEEVLKLSNHGGKGDMSRRQVTYTRPRVEKEEDLREEQVEGDDEDYDYDYDARDALSTTHIRATIDRLRQKKKEIPRPAQRKSNGGCIQPHRFRDGATSTTTPMKTDIVVVGGGDSGTNAAVSEDGDNSGGGSSTESDDEILSCWDENGDVIVPRTPVNVTATSVKAESESTVKTLQEDAFEYQQSPHKQVDNAVDPDLLELVSILETQARHLGEMFRQTKRARKEENRGRRYITKNIQLDCEERSRVLEDLKRREEELQREREEWELERSNMKRELAQLREQVSANQEETPGGPA